MRALLLLLLCASALALNFEASLMSHTLEEMGALDTSQLNCQTPRSHFNELESALGQWQTLLENKERIPEHIQTLTEMKSMIKHKKYEQLVEKLRSLDLVAPPVLAEIEGQLAGLQSHDKEERKHCTETLMKLCAYLIGQMNSLHQQCQQSPVTIIKVRGKIEDLKIIQSGCQAACQPNCDDVPEIPSIPSDPVPDDKSESEGPEEPDVPSEESAEESEEVPSIPSSERPDIPDIPEEPSQSEENPSEEQPDIPSEPSVPSEEAPSEENPSIPPDSEEQPSVPPSEEQPSEELPSIPSSEEAPSEEVPSEELPSIPPSEELPSEEQPSEEVPSIPSEELSSEEEPSEEQPSIPSEFPSEEEDGSESEPTLPSEPRSEESSSELPSEEESETPQSEESEIPSEEPIPSSEEGPSEEAPSEEAPSEEEPSQPDESEPEVPRECHAGGSTEVHTVTFNQDAHVIEEKVAVEGGTYAFSFWFQWNSHHPEVAHGSRFFIARLTNGANTVLGVYLTPEGVEFVSHSPASGKDESVKAAFEDIEGDWTHVYVSYKNNRAVGVVRYFEEKPILRELKVPHDNHSELTFQVGGSDGTSPSFQGQIYGAYAPTGNHFIGNLDQYGKLVHSCNPDPNFPCQRDTQNLGDFEFAGTETQFDAAAVKEIETWSDEYSVSGWFKWKETEEQEVWHTVFRLSSNKATSADTQMGDRDLAVYVGSEMVRSTLQFSTYTYTSFEGEGNPHLWQTVPYEDQLTKWHFIYFGYNRYERQAYVFVKFASKEFKLNFEDINHWVIPHKKLFIGQDENYPAYSGSFYNIHFNGCEGSYDLDPTKPPFGYVPEPKDPGEDPVPDPGTEESPEETESEEIQSEELPSEETPSEEQPSEELPSEELPSEETPSEEVPSEEEPSEPPSPPEPTPPKPDDPVPPPKPESPKPVPPPKPDDPVVPPEPKPEPPKPPGLPTTVPLQPKEPNCEHMIDVTKDNASDILCALSEYLAQLAAGHEPDLGVNPARVCFCLNYEDGANELEFLQIEQLVKQRDPQSLESLVIQRRRV